VHPPGRRLRDGGTLSAAHTEPNVNPDEVLAALDGDTRSYLTILLNDGGRALAGRGVDLRAVLRASQPAPRADQAHHRGARRPPRQARPARPQPRRLLSRTTATRTSQLARLVETADATVRRARLAGGFAAGLRLAAARHAAGGAGRAGLHTRLCGTARARADRAAPGGPRPRAPPCSRARPLLRDGQPILATQIRPLVHDAVPVARDLPPTLSDLRWRHPPSGLSLPRPQLRRQRTGLQPGLAAKGYLFWTAWFFHQLQQRRVARRTRTGWHGAANCSRPARRSTRSRRSLPLLQLVAAAPTLSTA